MQIRKRDYLLSFFSGKLIEEINSPLNGKLSVYLIYGKFILQAEHTNYSYGELHQAFRKIFRRINISDKAVKDCLLLGFGAGSVVSILHEELKMNCKITAIELDPLVLSLAKKYFKTQRFDNLNIVTKEAFEYVRQEDNKYDLIVFDIYVDNKIPPQFESMEFLSHCKRLLKADGLLVYNKDINEPQMNESLRNLEDAINILFEDVKKIQVVKNNYFFVCRKPKIFGDE